MPALLIAYGIKRNHLRKIVFITGLFGERTVDIGHFTVIVGVVSCIECVPPSTLGRIFLRTASRDNHQDDCHA